MPHDTAVIGMIAAALGIALLLGLLAARLKLPPIVGYLVAGIVVGPFTPGYVANSGFASQAAEVGVILLMFGVGLHFSLRDLLAVRRVVVPGALGQIAVTGTLGTTLGRLWGLDWAGSIVVGLSVAVASTVVVLKGLEARDRLDSSDGRLAVGWLVVEDLAMVVALVLLPALAGRGGSESLALPLAIALAKVAAFTALMIVVGRRAVPWLLAHVARVGSRELFTLTVLAIALGVGMLAAEVFGVSFALGAFFAGAVVSESELSHRAAADALPMQDAFAVLFFVSVGMLFDPKVLVEHPGQLLAILVLILGGKLLVAYGLLRALGQTSRTALTIAAGIAQIGEFSFIVAGLGLALGAITRDTQTLVVAGAIISITLNQPMLIALERTQRRRQARLHPAPPQPTYDFSPLRGHVVLVGYGRVGTTVMEALDRAGLPNVVVEEQERVVAGLRQRGERAIGGDATRLDVLERAGVAGARLVVVTAPEPIRARRIVEVIRSVAPHAAIAVRTHSAAEQTYYEQILGSPASPGRAVYAEREAALNLAHYALMTLGRSDDDADAILDAMRGRRTAPTETFAAMRTREIEAARVTPPTPRRGS